MVLTYLVENLILRMIGLGAFIVILYLFFDGMITIVDGSIILLPFCMILSFSRLTKSRTTCTAIILKFEIL